MKWILASLAAFAFLGTPAVSAQSWAPNDARNARQSGQIIPLRNIIRQLKQRYGGSYLNAELMSRGGGQSEYHIDWVTDDGRKMRFVVDAQNGRILRQSRG